MGQDFWYYNVTRDRDASYGDSKLNYFSPVALLLKFKKVIEHEGWSLTDHVVAVGTSNSLIEYNVVGDRVVIEHGTAGEHYFSDPEDDTDNPDS